MKSQSLLHSSIALAFAAVLLVGTPGRAFAQGQGGGHGNGGSHQGQGASHRADRAAERLATTTDRAANALGQDAVFCILAAHTTDVGTAQELKDRFASLSGVPLGQFVGAVILADRLDVSLDDVLTKLQAGESLGQISTEAGVNLGEVRREFGQFRSELARSITNPPTRDCFATP
jgi:hypothetical protein